jgi:hypothetical protein
LLSEDVEWGFRRDDGVEGTLLHRRQQGRALDELVPRERKQPALRCAAAAVAGAADPLEERGDAAG